jgi:hypothetical protein
MIVDGMNVERVDFEHEADWTNVTLADGTILKIKPEVNGVIRVAGMWDDNGDPIYKLNTQVRVAFVSVPDDLAKPQSNKTPVSELFAEYVKGKAN